MHSYRFLLSRRWALFAVAVLLAAWAAWLLGQWQFHRLEDRKASNAIVAANEKLTPAPVDDVLVPGREVDADQEWRLVTATGTYDPTDTVIVRYRHRDGVPGVDVVVPLVTSTGTSVVVDRGFHETDAREVDLSDVPVPPSGEVTVTGWVRVDGTGDSTQVDDHSTRAISSSRIGDALGREVYGGFVDMSSEDPPADDALQGPELPELDNGPHFFYGLQWWFFGLLAIFGFCYLAYDERRHGPRGERPHRVQPGQRARSMPPSTGSITPETNDAAGESRKAAARPNSSGSP